MDKPILRVHRARILELYKDREYFNRLINLALPIILQNFISSFLSMVGVMMIGQLGDTAIASVGLSNQIFFLLTLLLFGINSGAAMFTAQMWGKRDRANIRKVLVLALMVGLAASLVFWSLTQFAPGLVLGIYSTDPTVIAMGSDYLRIFGFSFLFTAVSFSFSAVLRSVGEVKTPLFVSMMALSLNTLLSYLLIFGKFSLPALGINGGALAICGARIFECVTLLWLTYRRKSPATVNFHDLILIDRSFLQKIFRRVLPVALNELLWSLGITAYNIVYARIGTESLAAMNIAATIDSLAMVVFLGMSHACAVMVGNRIGSHEEQKAFNYAGITLSLGVGGALFVGGLILLGSDLILSFYKVTELVISYTQNILTVIALLLWLRVSNMILFVGVFRSGGDTRYAFFLDVGTIWLVGVPLAFLGAFVFHLPIYFVYLLIMADEFVKCLIGLVRYFSKKWIHNLAIAF